MAIVSCSETCSSRVTLKVSLGARVVVKVRAEREIAVIKRETRAVVERPMPDASKQTALPVQSEALPNEKASIARLRSVARFVEVEAKLIVA
jgi:hypothetical protein